MDKNYAWTSGNPLPEPEPGTTFTHVNFHQREPHTPIFAGVAGLRFEECNLINCDLPADAVVAGGVRCQVNHCSHLHEKWVEKGLAVCGENCIHLMNTDTILVDGVEVDTVRHYKDQVVP